MAVEAPIEPHLWGVSGDIVVTVSGDLPRAELERVAGSLQPHRQLTGKPTPWPRNLSRQLAGVVPFVANYSLGSSTIGAAGGSHFMDLSGQVSYRQLAEEIGEVLQAAAETAEKMQEEARAEAAPHPG